LLPFDRNSVAIHYHFSFSHDLLGQFLIALCRSLVFEITEVVFSVVPCRTEQEAAAATAASATHSLPVIGLFKLELLRFLLVREYMTASSCID